MVGDIVYFATSSRAHDGLGARTGRKVFRFGRGGFNPVVSDGRDIFVPATRRSRAQAAGTARRLAHGRAAGQVGLELGHR